MMTADLATLDFPTPFIPESLLPAQCEPARRALGAAGEG